MKPFGRFSAAQVIALAVLASLPAALSGRTLFRPISLSSPHYGPRPKAKVQRSGTTYFRPNGKQECARRVRQIARGELQGSNGLLVGIHPQGRRWAVNSHGKPYLFYPQGVQS